MRGHVGATKCRLEMARVEFRRPHHHCDAVEGRPSLRVREQLAGDLDALATLSRRGQTHDRRVVDRARRDIGGREEPHLHATQRAWRVRVVGVVATATQGPRSASEALEPWVTGRRREQWRRTPADQRVRERHVASARQRRIHEDQRQRQFRRTVGMDCRSRQGQHLGAIGVAQLGHRLFDGREQPGEIAALGCAVVERRGGHTGQAHVGHGARERRHETG